MIGEGFLFSSNPDAFNRRDAKKAQSSLRIYKSTGKGHRGLDLCVLCVCAPRSLRLCIIYVLIHVLICSIRVICVPFKS